MGSPLRFIFLLEVCCFSAAAAPQLRLTQSVIYASQAVGANAYSQSLEAYNIGDGSLDLALTTSPSVSWLTASVLPMATAQNCYASIGTSCIPLVFTFDSSTLPRGVYTVDAVVSAANAIDAPQVITVTLQVGGSDTPIDVYLNPGRSLSLPFAPYTLPPPAYNSVVAIPSGGTWLSVVSTSGADSWFTLPSYIQISAPGMAAGTYMGSISVSDYFANDAHVVPVTMNVTTQPIAVPSMTQITATLAQGGPPVTYPFQPYISLSNSGLGTLSVQDVTGNGSGVSAYNYNGLAIVTLDPGSLDVGTYTDGVVTFQCNAANCPLEIPVTLQIIPRGPPVLNYQGAMANSGGSPGGTVAPGEVMIVQGQQLSNQPAAIASTYPLPATLGGTSVWVNGSSAPLYYSSSGQIAFQMPFEALPGSALVQVQRGDGQSSNFISVPVAPVAPEIVAITDSNYNVIDQNHPASPGETLVIWAIGLGQTSPALADGVAAPANPLATALVVPGVVFFDTAVAPSSVVAAPGEAGLYQVAVKAPDSQFDSGVYLLQSLPNSTRSVSSNTVPLWVQ